MTDFGVSCLDVDILPADNAQKMGAIRWKAPNVLSGESSSLFAFDVYSFGMTVIEIVMQILPWDMMTEVAVIGCGFA